MNDGRGWFIVYIFNVFGVADGDLILLQRIDAVCFLWLLDE